MVQATAVAATSPAAPPAPPAPPPSPPPPPPPQHTGPLATATATLPAASQKRKREEERDSSSKSKKKKMISTTSKETKKDTKLYCICKTPYDESKWVDRFWALVYFLKSLAVKFPVVKRRSAWVAMSMKVVEWK